MKDAQATWFLRLNPNPIATLRLFCLPHAGAGTWVFQNWQRELPNFVEVCPIRLPGTRQADEFLRLALPIMRSDFALCESYRCDEPYVLASPITEIRPGYGGHRRM